jgi:hypothetical protein
MLITAGLTAVVLATSLTAAATNASTLPPVTVIVTEIGALSPSLVSLLLEEASAVWRPTGLTFIWRRVPLTAAASPEQNPPGAPAALRVVIGPLRGRPSEGRMPLGWIQFDHGSPLEEIYVSYTNANEFMAGAQGVVGPIHNMPTLEREINLSRAMGRALAHELGHYLLKSKEHTRGGLMQATHTASDFFSFQRRSFTIDQAQRQEIAARLRQDGLVVSR